MKIISDTLTTPSLYPEALCITQRPNDRFGSGLFPSTALESCVFTATKGKSPSLSREAFVKFSKMNKLNIENKEYVALPRKEYENLQTRGSGQGGRPGKVVAC
jgi:hypothetical protein